jgi:hypothetical protein
MKKLLFLCLFLIGSSAQAGFVGLTSDAQLTGAITTLDFESATVNGPGMSFESGAYIGNASTFGQPAHSGSYGLVENDPFTSGPDNEATFTSGVYQVGLWFGNDDTCCAQAFNATLSAFDVSNNLIGSVSLAANMNDAIDQFLGIRTDTLIFKTLLDYGTASAELYGFIDDFSYGGDALVSQVPVPAAAFLFAPALLGFLGLRRKAANTAI